MHPQLVEIRKTLERNSDWFSRLAERTTEEEWGTRPGPEMWSASECVQHLNATSRAMVPRIVEQLEASRGGEKIRRFRFNFVGWMIWRSVLPRSRVKVKTQQAFIPRNVKPKRVDLVAWAVCQSDVLGAVEASDGHHIGRLKIASPFDARVRYNLYAAFRIIAAHQERHLDQAERAIEAVSQSS